MYAKMKQRDGGEETEEGRKWMVEQVNKLHGRWAARNRRKAAAA